MNFLLLTFTVKYVYLVKICILVTNPFWLRTSTTYKYRSLSDMDDVFACSLLLASRRFFFGRLRITCFIAVAMAQNTRNAVLSLVHTHIYNIYNINRNNIHLVKKHSTTNAPIGYLVCTDKPEFVTHGTQTNIYSFFCMLCGFWPQVLRVSHKKHNRIELQDAEL